MTDYKPQPIDTSKVILDDEVLALTELLAKNSHENWAAGRASQGWVYGPERNDQQKQTPCMVPYEDLPESEKEYDRSAAMEALKVIVALGCKIQVP